jgi:hypothetical protein
MKNIEIYRLGDKKVFDIVPLDVKRSWMDQSLDRDAYKCLPLNIANQYGWAVVCPENFSVSWFGGNRESDVEVFSSGSDLNDKKIISHFGEGTFTIQLDFIVKTPENYSTYIRGIPNKIDSILKPLDAIVETDWLPYTFTYNFKFAEPGVVEFKKGDLLFCFFPIERNSVENFVMVEKPISDNPELKDDYSKLLENRRNSVAKENGKPSFQRFYNTTVAPHKKFNVKNHIKRLIFGGKPDTIE